VPATVYRKKGAALVSIASWGPTDTDVQLKIDWTILGIDPAKATITAPDVVGFQMGKAYAADEKIKVPKNKGLMLVIK
jgi:hypothetical protein